MPPNLIQACPDLSPLNDGTGAAVLRKIVEVSKLYYECQRRHGALVKAVTKGE